MYTIITLTALRQHLGLSASDTADDARLLVASRLAPGVRCPKDLHTGPHEPLIGGRAGPEGVLDLPGLVAGFEVLAGFHENHALRRIGPEAVGQHAARRAGTDDQPVDAGFADGSVLRVSHRTSAGSRD